MCTAPPPPNPNGGKVTNATQLKFPCRKGKKTQRCSPVVVYDLTIDHNILLLRLYDVSTHGFQATLDDELTRWQSSQHIIGAIQDRHHLLSQ